MDKHKENEILLVRKEVVEYVEEVDIMKKEVELYNDIYKEISEHQPYILASDRNHHSCRHPYPCSQLSRNMS